MATTAERGTLAACTVGALVVVGLVLAVLVDPFTVVPAPVNASTAWIARVLLALGAGWVIIGAVSARTRLVRRPGAAATRATWIASTRPWRARESSLGLLPLDRWLMIAVPGALLVATRVLLAPPGAGASIAIPLAGWLVFAVAVRLLLGRRSPWPVIAAVGGALVLRCLVALGAVALSGPEGFWPRLWDAVPFRLAYVAIAFTALAWLFVAAGWSLVAQLGPRRAVGVALAGIGSSYALPAATVAAVGARDALQAWNEQVGVLPWHLAQVAANPDGDLPVDLVIASAAVGAVVGVVGVLLALPTRAYRRTRV